MANEISLSVNLTASKGPLRYQFAPPTANINLTGDSAAGAVQNISTTTEALSVIDVTTAGMATFLNLSTGTKVQVGAMQGTNFVPLLLLNYGEPAVARLATTSPVAKVTVPTNGTANVQWNVLSE